MEKPSALVIARQPEGGYLVTDASWLREPSRYCPDMFACTTIGEALAFVERKLSGIEPKDGIKQPGK